MYLTQIDILKYKSIKNPVSVYFNEGKVVTLIGKNGSGKTNVLEAIKYAMSKNHFYGRDKTECEIKYHIELTDEELDEYFSCVQTEQKSKEIIVDFNGNNLEQRFVSSSTIWIEAESFKLRLDSVLINFETAASKYIKALQRIETEPNYFGNYLDVKVEEENRGNLSYLMADHVKWVKDSIKRQIEEIKRYIESLFDGNKISLMRHSHIRSWDLHSDYIKFCKIAEDEQIKISPIVASSLKITKAELVKANKRLNKKIKNLNKILENEFGEIQNQLNEYKKIKAEIASIFDVEDEKLYEQNENLNKQFQSIIQRLRTVVFCNSYYLDNENSLIFYDSSNRQYRNEFTQQEYLNSKNPITEAFDLFLRDNGIIDEKTSITQRDKVEEKIITRAVKLLNTQFLPSILPKFDNDEVIKFEVRNDNGSLNLYVHEKNGDIVSFNNTSLGRRWYLTYQFVKALLEPGDMLLIDEPAAFLHPQAQVEFKKELELLAEHGVYVFYSTHSPYIIPEDWGQVYNVKMTESGTQVDRFNSGDGLVNVIKNDLGVTNTESILFNLSKTIILVEGVADKACIEKFASLLHKDLSNYYLHVCDGDSIVQMSYLCIKNAIKFLSIADNDNRFKDKKYKLSHPNFNKCLNEMLKNDDKCFFIGDGETGCLEDYFAEENNKFHYFEQKQNKWKIARGQIKKIESLDELQQKTINNFEQLFKRLDIPTLDDIKA